MTDDPPTTTAPQSFFRQRSDDSDPSGGTSTPAMALDQVLGDFRLVRKLGEGGMGQVWEAEQISLGRSVALKLMPSDRVLSEVQLALFEREAQAGGRLHHPNIVSVLAYGETDGMPFIAQELVGNGRTLKDVIQEARLGHEVADDWYQRIATFFSSCASALQVAHDAGVVHRDLKPANILVATNDRPMIADFGLARVSGVASISRTGELAGSYCYMSPEQTMAKRIEVDERTDIFSLGTTLYEALTLQRAFDGDSQQQISQGILWTDPPDPRTVRSKVPRDLAVICAKAMEKRPRDRYPSMAELAADLERTLAHQPIRARPAGPLLRAGKWARRHPTRSVAVTLTGVALVAISLLALQLEDTASALAERNTELISTVATRDAALVEMENQRDRADANATTARTHAEQATVAAARAEAERANVLRLSAFQDLQDLQGEADSLWPSTPALIGRYDAWIARARTLVAGLEPSLTGNDVGHRAQLLAIRERALPYSEADRESDRLTHPAYAEWKRTGDTITQTQEGLAAFRAGLGASEPSADQASMIAMVEQQLELAREQLSELNAAIHKRRTFAFVSADDRWWHNQLTHLIDEIDAFASQETGLLNGLSPRYGWGVARRRAFAETVAAQTLSGPEARARWSAVLASIADRQQCPQYDGLKLSPQVGLLPMGRDAASGLWEFWHVQSGDEPRRGADGQLQLTDTTGLVLVLIPAGSFWMGGQADDPAGQNYDPSAEDDEGPVHRVSLSPYLISKYEMTQGQWTAFVGHNPSNDNATSYSSQWNREGQPWSALHPVEQVSWDDALTVLPRLGLTLPTEAQWEYACRAGTETVHWSGDDTTSLQGVANVSDAFAHENGGAGWTTWEPGLDDGQTSAAEVGLFRANPFGLHDMHGNLWEWCMDGYDAAFYAGGSSLDPLSDPAGKRNRLYRGGSFSNSAASTRSSDRYGDTPNDRDDYLGIRPARALSP